jgi:hypothetical protein
MYSKNNKGNQTESMLGGVCSLSSRACAASISKHLVYFAHCSDAARTKQSSEARGFQGSGTKFSCKISLRPKIGNTTLEDFATPAKVQISTRKKTKFSAVGLAPALRYYLLGRRHIYETRQMAPKFNFGGSFSGKSGKASCE